MVKCPQCGSELVLRAGRWHCPRCDYWKESYGDKSWQKHARNVRALLEELKLRFPQVTWTGGLGALDGERLDLPPEHKGEPDLKGWWMRKHFVSIEVSGTDSAKVSVPPSDIYIGVWKVSHHSDVPIFFYMVYRSSTHTLPLSAVRLYRHNLATVPIRGKDETYIAVPYKAAMPGSELFALVAAELHRFDPRQTLREQSNETSRCSGRM